METVFVVVIIMLVTLVMFIWFNHLVCEMTNKGLYNIKHLDDRFHIRKNHPVEVYKKNRQYRSSIDVVDMNKHMEFLEGQEEMKRRNRYLMEELGLSMSL